jgi:hypothetical protein
MGLFQQPAYYDTFRLVNTSTPTMAARRRIEAISNGKR